MHTVALARVPACVGGPPPSPALATLNAAGRVVIPGPQGRTGNCNAFPGEKTRLSQQDFSKIVERLKVQENFKQLHGTDRPRMGGKF